MKLGIMQPYFFPYIGYWQLISAVDKYVVFNDVNYINRGWINRNRILCQGKPMYINILLSKASQNKKINEIDVLQDERHTAKLLRTLHDCYHKAPYFGETFEFISDILTSNVERRLDLYLFDIMRRVCGCLGITTPLVLSSEIPQKPDLRGETRIIALCEALGADEYYNAVGGQSLYNREHFQQEGISLCFLKTNPIVYRQFQNEFVANLSILDVMMFCSPEEIRELLGSYTLL